MITAIIFILILGVLIFVHELGHYLVAIRNGIKADEFGFGFPPRVFGVVKDERTGKKKIIWGKRNVKSKNTIFSLNWIPLGGFVRIKGEDGENKDSDSFATKSAWVRTKVLGAGVVMNFVLAWFLLSIVFFIGAPDVISEDSEAKNSKIQISQVVPETPAEKMGLGVGDEILEIRNYEKKTKKTTKTIADVQKFIESNKGEELILVVKRGDEKMSLKGISRIEYPEDQGSLGISLVRTAIVKYPWHESIWKGLVAVFDMIILIFMTLVGIIKNLIIGESVPVDIAGPVGIAFLTKQVTALGIVYILQFAAILSVNLGIINGFPFPALDGGRILFIIIEKIKGSPVSQKIETFFHATGFMLLILLMVVVTFRDFLRFEIVDKIRGIF